MPRLPALLVLMLALVAACGGSEPGEDTPIPVRNCEGTVAACETRSLETCEAALGCALAFHACFAEVCHVPACTERTDCGSFTSHEACDVEFGCVAWPSCQGTARACAELSVGECTRQPGCSPVE